MQAIILAAGMGKRLGDLTKNNTKCMVKVNEMTLIERMLKQLDQEKLQRIVLVIGYEGKKLKSYISGLDINTAIEYIENPVFEITNNIYSLFLARDKLKEDDTILLESDLIFDDAVLKKIINEPYPSLALVAKFESWMNGTVALIDEQNNINRFISSKQFRFEETSSYYKTVNIYKFSKNFATTHYIPFLEAYCKALGHNEYYEQVLKVITLLDKPEIKALRLDRESWYEIDDIQDLDIAESIFETGDDKLKKIQRRYGGYWRYSSLIDFCYLVNPYFPSEMLKLEIKTNFDRLITEYPSGIEVNSLLAGKYLGIKPGYTCVGNGAAELIKSLMNFLEGKFGICYPTFEEYPIRLPDNRIVPFTPGNINFSYGINDLIEFYEGGKINNLVLINPDNPSGNFIPKKDLLILLNWTKTNDIILILDESFVDFACNYDQSTLLFDEILEKNPNLIIIKSISKSYGVPGLRLGIIATSDKEIINFIRKDISIWNINSFAEFYLQIFGKYEADYREGNKTFIKERERFKDNLNTIPFLRVIPSQANFFLCEVLPPFDSTSLTKLLLIEHNILVKDCKHKIGFERKEHIRIAVRNQIDNDHLIQILSNL